MSALQSLQKKKIEDVKVYIASGFFDQIQPVPILNFTDSKLKTDLLNSLSGFDVEVFGAYSGRNNLLDLKNNLIGHASTVKAYYKYRFHAKIFVIVVGDKIVCEIIGSSNMTNCAYKGLSKNKFSPNVECDLIIFDEKICDVDINLNEDVMQFTYENDKNNDISIEQRMLTVLDYLNNYKSNMKLL